jgi:hypothetical protein
MAGSWSTSDGSRTWSSSATTTTGNRHIRGEYLDGQLGCGGGTRHSQYGQTCFLNSVLQFLAALEPFLVYLDHVVQQEQAERQQQQSHEWFLCWEDGDIGVDDDEPQTVVSSRWFLGSSRSSEHEHMSKSLSATSNTSSLQQQQQQQSEELSFSERLRDILMTSFDTYYHLSNSRRIDPRILLRVVGRKHQQFRPRQGK